MLPAHDGDQGGRDPRDRDPGEQVPGVGPEGGADQTAGPTTGPTTGRTTERMAEGGHVRPFVIREVTDPWAFRALERVQVSAWGYPDREVLPGTMFRISAVTGGIVLGGYAKLPPEDPASLVPVGLAFGFPALRGAEVWHHSHLLAVHPAWRGTGLAVALKLAQRERALAQGLTRMTWTFDPLVSRNARLNLGKLGAVARTYLPDWYALEDDRAGAFPADRLLIEWDLTRPHAERPAPPPRGQVALEALDGAQEPGAARLYLAGARVLVEVPTRPEALELPVRRAWRDALREVLGTYLSRGYEVVDLARAGHRAHYVLARVTGGAQREGGREGGGAAGGR
ncbi:acyl-CoA N-acyltransferase [Deinococcus knuensis]|uniref:Acyl-CoA N-acyltransferase n=2 Tax=Deinococcus knuensis TaxID=1837380 RepID=A0ABQ2SXT6_9DEIO|nr:acyl-CoA N-acyltransferase [Deinococcus knuensis]